MNINTAVTGSEYNAYSLDITTSTGDHISLDMSRTQEVNLSQKQNENSFSRSFSYTSIEKFNFVYEGNGLDKNDIKEIKQALEKSEPMMQKFMESFSDEMKSLIPLSAQTLKIADLFIPIKDKVNEDTFNFAKKSLVQQMDEVIKSLNKKDLIQEGARFLEKLFDNMNRRELFIYG